MPPGEQLAASTRAKFLSFLQTYTLEEEANGGGIGTDGNATAVSDASVQRTRRGGSARGSRSQTQVDDTGPTPTAGQQPDQQQQPRQAPQQPYYVSVLAAMVGSQSATLPVEWSHLESANPGLADLIADDHLRLDGALRAAVADFVAAHAPEYAVTEVIRFLMISRWRVIIRRRRASIDVKKKKWRQNLRRGIRACLCRFLFCCASAFDRMHEGSPIERKKRRFEMVP